MRGLTPHERQALRALRTRLLSRAEAMALPDAAFTPWDEAEVEALRGLVARGLAVDVEYRWETRDAWHETAHYARTPQGDLALRLELLIDTRVSS